MAYFLSFLSFIVLASCLLTNCISFSTGSGFFLSSSSSSSFCSPPFHFLILGLKVQFLLSSKAPCSELLRTASGWESLSQLSRRPLPSFSLDLRSFDFLLALGLLLMTRDISSMVLWLLLRPLNSLLLFRLPKGSVLLTIIFFLGGMGLERDTFGISMDCELGWTFCELREGDFADCLGTFFIFPVERGDLEEGLLLLLPGSTFRSPMATSRCSSLSTRPAASSIALFISLGRVATFSFPSSIKLAAAFKATGVVSFFRSLGSSKDWAAICRN
mmetsp:Transcript_6005/g.10912  ORF Transcript_6005/g.10912 Transcript_6005/m.10912 type:complete len:273 (+) Transcript_6005:2967-3785(+)